jgi:hypothetical protein
LCGIALAFARFMMMNQPIQPRPVAAFTFSSLMETGGHSPFAAAFACPFAAMA